MPSMSSSLVEIKSMSSAFRPCFGDEVASCSVFIAGLVVTVAAAAAAAERRRTAPTPVVTDLGVAAAVDVDVLPRERPRRAGAAS